MRETPFQARDVPMTETGKARLEGYSLVTEKPTIGK